MSKPTRRHESHWVVGFAGWCVWLSLGRMDATTAQAQVQERPKSRNLEAADSYPAPNPAGPLNWRTIANIEAVTDPTGEITDQQLRKDTGWDTLRAVAVQLEADITGNKNFTVVPHHHVFRSGNDVRVRLETSVQLFLCVAVKNADGSFKMLVPGSGGTLPLHERRKPETTPPSGSWRFKPPAGEEILYLFFFSKLPPYMRQAGLVEFLEKRTKGENPTGEEQQAEANLRSANVSRGLREIAQATDGKRVDKGIGDIMDDFANRRRERGARIVGVNTPEPNDGHVRLHFHGAKKGDPSDFVVKVVLKHE